MELVFGLLTPLFLVILILAVAGWAMHRRPEA
jgi:hypothetical protein